MSCLKKKYRIRKKSSFENIYRTAKRVSCPLLIIYFKQSSNFKIAFVASKKVGNSVERNLAKRKLKALTLEAQQKKELPLGSYILIAKNEILQFSFEKIQQQFISLIQKITK